MYYLDKNVSSEMSEYIHVYPVLINFKDLVLSSLGLRFLCSVFCMVKLCLFLDEVCILLSGEGSQLQITGLWV